jgi:hypothetical protein
MRKYSTFVLYVPYALQSRVYIAYPRVLCHELRRRKQQSRRLTLPKVACCTGMGATFHYSLSAPTLFQPSVGSQRGFVRDTCRSRTKGHGLKPQVSTRGRCLPACTWKRDGKVKYKAQCLSFPSLHNLSFQPGWIRSFIFSEAMEWLSRGGRAPPLYIILILLGWISLCHCLGMVLTLSNRSHTIPYSFK